MKKGSTLIFILVYPDVSMKFQGSNGVLNTNLVLTHVSKGKSEEGEGAINAEV